MKTQSRSGALMCAFFFACAVSLSGQGSLTPPGPPAPTMKPLSRIDPGKALNPASFGTTGIEIDQPGYYYLTGNVTTVPATEAAIVVNASFVTIDLRGFSIVAATGTGSGLFDSAILVNGVGQSDVTVRNGVIRGAWWAGFHAQGTNCAADHLRVIGTVSYGIRLDVEARVTDCMVDGLSATGFITGAGIFTGDHSLVKNCIVSLCDGNGFQTGSHSSMLDCVAFNNVLAGITTGNGSTISRCASS